ncbi:MAG: HupE/UreJ family protein [Polyangiaceae bacterium]
MRDRRGAAARWCARTTRRSPSRPRRLGSLPSSRSRGSGRVTSRAGLDHLLFIAGVVLLGARARAIAASLTAFTAGHSVTLAATVTHVLRIPPAVAELAIAGSLLFLGLRVVLSDGPEPPRRLAIAAGSMGLLHGLGFAYALEEVGLPEGEIPLSLFGFNLGIELGQLALVAALLCAGWVASRARAKIPLPSPSGALAAVAHRLDARRLAGYALGGAAAMWCIERALVLRAVLYRRGRRGARAVYTEGVSGSRNEAFARVAHLFGRLAHVFADREAILERHSLTEDSYRALERRTIEALLGASPAELANFARAFAEERAELLGLVAPKPAAPAPSPPSATVVVAPPAAAPPSSPRNDARTLRQAAYEPASIDDLMETLHIPTSGPRPPR